MNETTSSKVHLEMATDSEACPTMPCIPIGRVLAWHSAFRQKCEKFWTIVTLSILSKSNTIKTELLPKRLLTLEYQKDRSRTLCFSTNWQNLFLKQMGLSATSPSVTNQFFRLELPRPRLGRGANCRRYIALTSEFLVLLLSWQSLGEGCREASTSDRRWVHARIRGVLCCGSGSEAQFSPDRKEPLSLNNMAMWSMVSASQFPWRQSLKQDPLGPMLDIFCRSSK